MTGRPDWQITRLSCCIFKTNSIYGGKLMDIYSFALQMEKDGENYYRELATKSGSEGLKKIFTMLADEEVKHFRLIEKMREKSTLPEICRRAGAHRDKKYFYPDERRQT